MIFFRKKKPEAEKPKKPVPKPPAEKVLTAEGWRRRVLLKKK
jgi:hypothetical protein